MADNFSVEDKDKNSLAKDVPSPVTISQLTPNTIYSGWLATKNDGDATLMIPDQTTLPSKPSMTLTAGTKQFTANVKLATGDGSAPITKAVISYKNGDNDAKTKEFDKPINLSSLVVDGLADGTDYDATVVVSNASGDSGASDSVSVTTDSAKIAVTNVTGITADKSLTVQVGKTAKINAVIAPDDATDKGVTYKSADITLATVDDDGTVHGVKATDPGKTVQITAASHADPTKTVDVPVTVTTAS